MDKPTFDVNTMGNLEVFIPMLLKKKSGRKMVIAPNAIDGPNLYAEPEIQEPLVQAIVRAWAWRESIESGKIQGIYALSKKLRLDNSFVTRILKLTFLAPDITMAILKGKEPSGLSLTKLLRPFPDDWDEQRKMMGF